MSTASAVNASSDLSWFERNAFLLRRLHSLSGVIPVGLFVTFHLLANSTILMGSSVFQFAVEKINSLGPLVPILSIGLILIPITFHAVLGILYTLSAKPNTGVYGYSGNIRYLLQRVSGVILIVFIFYHVLTLKFGVGPTPFVHDEAVGGDNVGAVSTGLALRYSWWVTLLYILGVASAVYHWANGIWTFLITWGITIGEQAQKKATVLCTVFGVAIGVLSLSAVVKFAAMPVQATPEQMKTFRQEQNQVSTGGHERASVTVRGAASGSPVMPEVTLPAK